MTTLRFHRLSVRRFTKFLTNYIYSESLITEDYEYFDKEKYNCVENRAHVSKKYIVHKIGAAPVETDLERNGAEFFTPWSQKPCLGIFFIWPGLFSALSQHPSSFFNGS